MSQQTIEGFRLSHQQQRIWLLQMDRSGVYRAQCAVLLEGKLEREKITAALHEVVRRHEILRTSFRSLPSMVLPLQVVDPKGVASIEWHDLTNLEATAQSAETHSVIRTLPAFEQNGLPRFDILMFSAREHILVLTLSALCADEVTLKNLVSEISGCYHGKPEPAVDGPTQYVDYAEWQHDLFESEDTEEERNYWRHTNLSSSLDVKLPLENAVGHVHSFAPATLSTTVGRETLSKIDAFTTARDLTYREFLFACWQTLLWRLTHQAEIVITGACDCRSYA